MKADTLIKRVILLLILFLHTQRAFCEKNNLDEESKEITKSVYVPVYSHIYFGDALRPFNLAATVSIRNVGRTGSVVLIGAEYRNSEGKLLRKLIESPVVVPPLASHTLKVKESDNSGGSGASVVITWHSIDNSATPLIESVMIGTANGQGISFTSRSIEIKQGGERK